MSCYLRSPNHMEHYCGDCKYMDFNLDELPCRKCFTDSKHKKPGERQKCGWEKLIG